MRAGLAGWSGGRVAGWDDLIGGAVLSWLAVPVEAFTFALCTGFLRPFYRAIIVLV